MESTRFPTREERAADRVVRHNDLYAKMTARQQQGLPCWLCNSLWGHYARCPLLNGGVRYTEEQKAVLREHGLREDEGWWFKPEKDNLPRRYSTWVEFCKEAHIHNHRNDAEHI
jgi:hypothetical protein